MKKILAVDDEILMLQLLEHLLEKENYKVITARNGEEALMILDKLTIDAVLLDLELPDIEGLDILKHIRQTPRLKHLPVLIVTANDNEIDTILGLEIGADDYITKPFKKRELSARIKAVFMRVERDREFNGQVITFGNVKVFLDHRRVLVNEVDIEIAPKEFALLTTLIQYPKKVYTREELLNIVWNGEVSIEERTVDVHIRRLRKKIEPNPEKPIWIETIRGVGYRFSKNSLLRR